MSAEPGYLISISGVTVRYSDEKNCTKTVLNDVSLNVQEGELVTLVGPTGCGKSTLLRSILGSETPTTGEVSVGGKVLHGLSRDRGIVFQRYSLFPHKTVLENIVFGLELEKFNLLERLVTPMLFRKEHKAFKKQALEYLDHIGLQKSDAEKYPFQLSGGMQQRVAIAQAIIMKPKVLLMDEPFGALDDATREKMQLFLLEQWESTKMTIFFVTHDLEEALFLGTRVIVLSQHYVDDAGNAEGSKIVIDKKVPEASSSSTDQKYSAEFTELLHQIRSEGLDASRKKHVRDFDMSHPDALKIGGTR